MSLPNQASDHLLRQMLGGLFKDPEMVRSTEGIEENLHSKALSGELTVPGGTSLSVIATRFPVLADLLRGRRSTLVKILEDREDETIMVVDSILSGGKACFFARLVKEPGHLQGWLEAQQWPLVRTIIQPIDHETVLVVSLVENFVLRSDEAVS